MTVQPTQAFVVPAVRTISKVPAMMGVFLHLLLQMQQHEDERHTLKKQCEFPKNKESPLCQPFFNKNTNPFPLKDIQKWIKEQCQSNATCIRKIVKNLEDLFTILTKTPIQLGPTLCTHPNFTFLVENVENLGKYCNESRFLPSKFGTPKPGGTNGTVGGTPVSSSANPPRKTSTSAGTVRKTPTSSSAKPSTGETGNSQVPVGTQTDLGQEVKNKINSKSTHIKEDIEKYEWELKRRGSIPKKEIPQFDPFHKPFYKKSSSYIRKKLGKAKKIREILTKLRDKMKVLQERTQVLKKMISEGVPVSDIEKENNVIQRELEELLLEYNEKVLGKTNPLGIKNLESWESFKNEIIQQYPTSTSQGKKIRKLIQEIENLQDEIDDSLDRMVRKTSKKEKEEIEELIRGINEKIEIKLKEIKTYKK
jgi:hypothetical protein